MEPEIDDIRSVLDPPHDGMDSILVEIRVLDVPKKGVMSGYFDDPDQLEKWIGMYGDKGNWYRVLNPVDSNLKGRGYNKLRSWAKNLTSDNEVPHRYNILIDFDPKRPTGVGSTDEEHRAAIRLAKEVSRALRFDYAFPDMFRADSGNGAHLIVPCDMPNTPENTSLIKTFLQSVQRLFEADEIKVDTAVFNAARLVRLHGTVNRKGDNIPDRPHRCSCLLHVPKKREPVSREAIEKVIAASGIQAAVSQIPQVLESNRRFDLAAFIEKHGIEVSQVEEEDKCTTYHLVECPFNREHKGKDSALVQFKDGAIGFHCFHDSCSDKQWRDVRMLYNGEDEEFEKECAACEHSDMGNGYRLILRHGEILLYVEINGTWYIWNGHYWEPDKTGQVLDIAGKTAERIKTTEAKTIPPDYDDEGEEDWSRRDAHIAFGVKSENVHRREAMLKSARCDERIRRTPGDWNLDPWSFCVANGTIELGNGGLLRPHDPKDMITKMVDIVYDPEAKCPLFIKFLKRTVPDLEERRYLQKYIGYCLTGVTVEQCFLLIYGRGHNGKSVLIDTIQELLSPYHFHASAKTIMQADRPKDDYTLAELPGIRLLTLDELDERDILNEAMIKNMTGNDMLSARHPFGRPFSFVPQFKIILYGNHRPKIVGTDNGIWRRPKLLHFAQTISASERDPDLPNKLKDELPGILAWAVRGCLRWQVEGLDEPESMKLALRQYRSEMDTFQQFVDECILATEEDSDTVAGQYMYDHYKYWCHRSGHKAFSISKFNSRMLDRGFKKAHKKTGNYWISLIVRPMEDTDDVPLGLPRY